MRYLHTMVRVADIDASLDFYCNKLGMTEVRRVESEAGRFTLIFLAASEDEQAGRDSRAPLLELTHNWDPEAYGEGRNFGHLAFEVDDIYATCQSLMDAGVTINRPPRDGRMAFIRSPDNISIELLQKGDAQAAAEIAVTRAAGGRVIPVGTTALRLIETAAQGGEIAPWEGETDIFIYPGFHFRVTDALMTNFHLPRSTLMMLVSALMGPEAIRRIYAHAIAEGYRFFSYGDASLLIPDRPA